MKDPQNEIEIIARRMKATVPIGQPLHQIKKLIEVLEERRQIQPKFTPQRSKHWQENYDRLSSLKGQLECKFENSTGLVKLS